MRASTDVITAGAKGCADAAHPSSKCQQSTPLLAIIFAEPKISSLLDETHFRPYDFHRHRKSILDADLLQFAELELLAIADQGCPCRMDTCKARVRGWNNAGGDIGNFVIHVDVLTRMR